MKNYKKITFTIFLLATLALVSVLLIYPILDSKSQLDFIKQEYSENPIFSEYQISPIEGGFNTLTKYAASTKLILTQFDLLNPIYSIVIHYEAIPETNNNSYQDVRVIYLRRIGIDRFEIKHFTNNRVDDLSFEDAIELVAKYDISSTFPDKESYNITNYPKPNYTTEQVEAEKERREELEKAQEEFNNLTDEELFTLIIEEFIREKENQTKFSEENLTYIREQISSILKKNPELINTVSQEERELAKDILP